MYSPAPHTSDEYSANNNKKSDGGESSRNPPSSDEALSPNGNAQLSGRKSDGKETTDIPLKKLYLGSRTSREDKEENADESDNARIGMANGSMDNLEVSDDASDNTVPVKNIVSHETDAYQEGISSNQELLEYEDADYEGYTVEGDLEDFKCRKTGEGEDQTYYETNIENEGLESNELIFGEEEENENEENNSEEDEDEEDRAMVIDEPLVPSDDNDVVVVDDSDDDTRQNEDYVSSDVSRRHQNSRKRHLPYEKTVPIKRKRLSGIMRRLPKPDDVMCISSEDEENNFENNQADTGDKDSEKESIEENESGEEYDSEELYYDDYEENEGESDDQGGDGRTVYFVGERRRLKRGEESDNEDFSEHSEEHPEDEENLSEQSEGNAPDDEEFLEANEEVEGDENLSGEAAENENIEGYVSGEGVEHEPLSDNCVEIIECKTVLSVNEENEIELDKTDKLGGSSEDLAENKKKNYLEDMIQVGLQELESEEDLILSEDGEENLQKGNKKIKFNQGQFQEREDDHCDEYAQVVHYEEQIQDVRYVEQIEIDEGNVVEDQSPEGEVRHLKRSAKYEPNTEHKLLHDLSESLMSNDHDDDDDEINDESLSGSSDEDFDVKNNSFNTVEENFEDNDQIEAYYQTRGNEESEHLSDEPKKFTQQHGSKLADKGILVIKDYNPIHKHLVRKKAKMSREELPTFEKDMSCTDHSTDNEEDELEESLSDEYDSETSDIHAAENIDNEEGMMETEEETSDEGDCFMMERHRSSGSGENSLKSKMQVIKRNDILLSKTYRPVNKEFEDRDVLLEVDSKKLGTKDMMCRCVDKRSVREEFLKDLDISNLPDFHSPMDSSSDDVVSLIDKESSKPTANTSDTENLKLTVFRLQNGKIILPDKEKLCRLCLGTSQEMYPLFFKETPKEKLKNFTALSHLWACIPICIKEHDELPKKVCQKCYETLWKYFKFSERCLEVNGMLESYLFETCSVDAHLFSTASSTHEEIDKHSEMPDVAEKAPQEATHEDVPKTLKEDMLNLRNFEDADSDWRRLCSESGQTSVIPGFKVTTPSNRDADSQVCEGNDVEGRDRQLPKALETSSTEIIMVMEETKSRNDLPSDKEHISSSESQEILKINSLQRTFDAEKHVSNEEKTTLSANIMEVDVTDVKDTMENNSVENTSSEGKETDNSSDNKVNDVFKSNVTNDITSTAENVHINEQVVLNNSVMEVEEHNAEIAICQSVIVEEKERPTLVTGMEKNTAEAEKRVEEVTIADSVKASEKIEEKVSNEEKMMETCVAHITQGSGISKETDNKVVTQKTSAMEIDEDDKEGTVTYPIKDSVQSVARGSEHSLNDHSVNKKRKREDMHSDRHAKTARADEDKANLLNFMLDNENFIVMKYSTFEGLFQPEIEAQRSTPNVETIIDLSSNENSVSGKSLSNLVFEVENRTSENLNMDCSQLPDCEKVHNVERSSDKDGNKNIEAFSIPESNLQVVKDSEIIISRLCPSEELSAKDVDQVGKKNGQASKIPDINRHDVKDIDVIISDLGSSEESSSKVEIQADNRNEESNLGQSEESSTKDQIQADDKNEKSDFNPSEEPCTENQVQAKDKSAVIDLGLSGGPSTKSQVQADDKNEGSDLGLSEGSSTISQVHADNKNKESELGPSEGLSTKSQAHADDNNEGSDLGPSEGSSTNNQVQADYKHERTYSMPEESSQTVENSENISGHSHSSGESAENQVKADNKSENTLDMPESIKPSVENSEAVTIGVCPSVKESETSNKNEGTHRLSESTCSSVAKSETIISDAKLKTENSDIGLEKRTSLCEKTSEVKQSSEVIVDEVVLSSVSLTDSITVQGDKKDSSDPR